MGSSAGASGRSSLPLLIALGVLFVLESVATRGSALLAIAYGAVLIGSAWALSRDRRHVLLTAVLLVVALAARVAYEASPGRATLVLAHAAAVLFLGWSAALLFRLSVASPGRVHGDQILGAICVYLMLGVIGAAITSAIAALQPGSFRFPEGTTLDGPSLETDTSSFLYFSFVTLATLGYGDITPVTPLARTFSWMLAVAGQMYVAIVVARLVSLGFGGKADETDRGAG